MEGLLINLLVAVIVFAIIAAVIKGLQAGGYLDATIARIAILIVGGIFLIYLLVRVLFPLLHMQTSLSLFSAAGAVLA